MFSYVTFCVCFQRLITGVENLDEVESLELKVNTEETSLGNFGSLLPNLRQLKLSDSVIPRIRWAGCQGAYWKETSSSSFCSVVNYIKIWHCSH